MAPWKARVAPSLPRIGTYLALGDSISIDDSRLVGSFPPDDLAVVKVSGADLKPASFADSSKLRVGDLAVAIGSRLGCGRA